MPKDTNIKKVLVIGSGPIIIGQAAEFDYAGTQACRALKEEGIEVVLVNSNPATIMTDPGLADRTYIEPIEPETVAAIIRRERPDALLPTMGGQTALNTSLALSENGVLGECGVELLGAERLIYGRLNGEALIVRVEESGPAPAPGSRIHVTPRDGRVHAFDAASGKRK